MCLFLFMWLKICSEKEACNFFQASHIASEILKQPDSATSWSSTLSGGRLQGVGGSSPPLATGAGMSVREMTDICSEKGYTRFLKKSVIDNMVSSFHP
jgi:hypothetical protein